MAYWRLCDVIFVFSDPENPRLEILDRFRIIFRENSWRRRVWSMPWAPGAPGVLGGVIFVFSDPENTRLEILDRFRIILRENSWGRRGWSTPWAPGASGVLGDVIFVFSDLENLIGPKLGSFALLLPKLIIFNTYLLEDALVKMHFPIRKMHFSKCKKKKPGQSFLMSSWIACTLNHEDRCGAQNFWAFALFWPSLTRLLRFKAK